jgi:RNase P subunit RPR2
MTAETRTISAGETQLCPKCRTPMAVSDVIPTMPTTGLDEDELVYRCHGCGAEVKRVVERHRSG